MPTLSNKWYDRAKWLVQIVLPAISAAYFALAELYEWDNALKVVGTLAIVTTFLGVILGLSSAQYNSSGLQYDGQMLVRVDPGGALTPKLELNEGFDKLNEQGDLKLQVVRTYDPPAE
jgi:hypothetical protein